MMWNIPMPSSTRKQANLMRAVAHGFKPDKFKGPPVSVAKEFVAADKKAHKFQGKMESMRGKAKTSAEKRFDKAKPY
jgi:hypothetical protein